MRFLRTTATLVFCLVLTQQSPAAQNSISNSTDAGTTGSGLVKTELTVTGTPGDTYVLLGIRGKSHDLRAAAWLRITRGVMPASGVMVLPFVASDPADKSKTPVTYALVSRLKAPVFFDLAQITASARHATPDDPTVQPYIVIDRKTANCLFWCLLFSAGDPLCFLICAFWPFDPIGGQLAFL